MTGPEGSHIMDHGMPCQKANANLSCYLDGALDAGLRRQVALHLQQCAGCRREYSALQVTRSMTHSLGRVEPPAELARALRVTISQRTAAAGRRRWQGAVVRLQNSLNAFMLPATAGVLSAVIVFGSLINFISIRALAAGDDVPTTLFMPPRLASAPDSSFISSDALVVVEAFVDAQGRVEQYRILGGAEDSPALRKQLDNLMIFTTFHPATTFGTPSPGRVVLSLSRVSVKG